ncbi:MAG: efflux RND transporter periplasmic adaptor subunit [Betaproteobacteria bacterium]|nr:efflux RND transporter periplasmic adaptor subunit [Betaproteobacteria bacterium]
MKKILVRTLWTAAVIGITVLVVLAFQPQPIKVETARAARGPLVVTVDEEGETRAHDRYLVAAPVAGRLERIALHEGDAVAEGDVLARLQPIPLSAREREEQLARVAAAEAIVREAEERVRRAAVTAEQASRERERVDKLVSQGFISPQAAEQAKVVETTARNELDAARYHAQSARADARSARAGLMAVAPAGGKAPVIEVRAPAAGRVLRIPEKSERVIAAGAPLVTLGDPQALEIIIDVLSTDAVKVKPGMPVLLEGWGGSGVLRAKVRVIEPFAFTKVSALGVEEQRVNIIADFVDPPRPLGDGYKVDARIVIWEAQDVLRVPASALFRVGDSWALFVVEEGRARRREVKVGQRNSTYAEIAEGIGAGAAVIRHPSNEITDGARVEVR